MISVPAPSEERKNEFTPQEPEEYSQNRLTIKSVSVELVEIVHFTVLISIVCNILLYV